MIRNRYRIIVCCVFCLFLTNNVTSQLHIGLQSGLLFSRAGIISKNKDLVTPTTNYIMTNATNLYLSYTLSPAFTLAVEPGYMQKSNEQNGGLTYIQLPVLAEYTLIDRLRLTALVRSSIFYWITTVKKATKDWMLPYSWVHITECTAPSIWASSSAAPQDRSWNMTL